MPAPTVRGSFNELIRQWATDLVTNDQNKSEYQVSWKVHKDSWIAKAPAIGSQSDDYPGLYLSERRVHVEGVVAEITGIYRGQVGVFFDTAPAPEYSLTIDGMDIPIEQHPDFDNPAKFPTADKVTDNDGKFTGFTAESDFRGIQSYLVASARWVERRYERQRPGEEEIYLIGKRMAPAGLRNHTTGHWLFVGCDFQQRGGFWVVTRQWTYSGPDKEWDKKIYGE